MNDDPRETLRNDPVMARLLDTYDPYSERNWDEFERLVVSIINQQLSTASATAVRDRVFDSLDGDVTPEAVLAAEREALRESGLSRTKIDYIRNAAEAFLEHDLTRDGLADLSDEAVIDRLTEIKGIGEWTARMYLLFVLERDDVLPLGDLAVRRGIDRLYGTDDGEMTRAEMREIAERWRPYRSHAVLYIWAAYEADDLGGV
ncbi:DNA-3-methyladenine glycosylase family protein [Haloferacaceae archaeon DSL9]